MNAPIKPINAAHEALLNSTDALCVDAVAAATGLNKRDAAKQIKQLAGLGMIEPAHSFGMPFYRLIAAPASEINDVAEVGDTNVVVLGDSEGGEADAPAADADGWIPWVATADSVCPVPDGTLTIVRWENGDEVVWNCPENGSWSPVSPEIFIVAYKTFTYYKADDDLLAAANRSLGGMMKAITAERDDLRARLDAVTQQSIADTDALTQQIERLKARLAERNSALACERIARHAIEERADVEKYAPSGYLVCATKRKPRRINDGERAKLAALAAVRAGAARAEVLRCWPWCRLEPPGAGLNGGERDDLRSMALHVPVRRAGREVGLFQSRGIGPAGSRA